MTAFIDRTAATVNLHAVAGDTVTVTTAPITAAGSPLDLTGYTLLCQIRDKLSGALLLTPAVTVSGTDHNVLSITLSAADTGATLGAGQFAWGLEWTDTGGKVRTVWAGLVTLDQEVTHV